MAKPARNLWVHLQSRPLTNTMSGSPWSQLKNHEPTSGEEESAIQKSPSHVSCDNEWPAEKLQIVLVYRIEARCSRRLVSIGTTVSVASWDSGASGRQTGGNPDKMLHNWARVYLPPSDFDVAYYLCVPNGKTNDPGRRHATYTGGSDGYAEPNSDQAQDR